MAKSKYSLKMIILTSVTLVMVACALIGIALPFLTINLGPVLGNATLTVFKFEETLGIFAMICAIITLLLLLATAVLTGLKFTSVKVPRVVELVIFIATIVFGALTMVLTMAYCADISKPLGTNAFTLTFTSFMFTIGSVAAGAVALANNEK